MAAALATGHPAIPTGDFDFTPLLYMGCVLLLIRRIGLPVKIWVLPIAMVAGGLIEGFTHWLELPTPTAAAILTLVALFVHPPRAPTRLHPPDV